MKLQPSTSPLLNWRSHIVVLIILSLENTEAKTLPDSSSAATSNGVSYKCFPACQNGGECKEECIGADININICKKMTYCVCPKGFEGRSCETDSCHARSLSIPTTKFVMSRSTDNNAILECDEGFKPKMMEKMDLECVEGEWTPSAEHVLTSDFRCDPVCDGLVLNNGLCLSPNNYLCPFPYGGPSCELRVDKECENVDEDDFQHAEIVSQDAAGTKIEKALTMTIRCTDGYAFAENGIKEQQFLCVDGQWTFQSGTSAKILSNDTILCNPVCETPCQNGGECVDPNECKCQENFKGAFCEKRSCLGLKLEVEHGHYEDENSDSPKVKCDDGYQLPNGLAETHLICTENGWELDQLEGVLKVICEIRTECPGIPRNIPYAEIEDVFPGLKEATCIEGFAFASGQTTSLIACLDGVWEIAGNKSLGEACAPLCSPPCQNGGYCQNPNKCICPPNTEGDQCQERKCGVKPVRGSVIYTEISSSLLKIECENETTFQNGEKNLILECKDGNYQLPNPYAKNDIILECQASCQGKCLNGGTCESSGKCSCLPGYKGSLCEEKVICNYEFPHVANAAQRKLSEQEFLLTCIPGHRLPGNKNAISVKCIEGKWKIEGYTFQGVTLECQPFCEGNCSNHGICVFPDMCTCLPGFTGFKCESRIDLGCLDAPPKVENAVMQYNVTDGQYSCLLGYQMPEGETKKLLQCRRGRWSILDCACNDNPPSCEPTCDPTCQNEGICIAPNKCKCMEDYIGDWCQSPKPKECHDVPPPVPNSLIEISRSGSKISCNKGYEFMSGAVKESIWCNNGVWSFSSLTTKGHKRSCYPLCSVPCLNNGKCVAPETCQCVAPFTGRHCEKLEKNMCWTKPPKIEFATVQYSSALTVIKCLHGYAFHSGEESLNLTCINGKWSLRASIETALPPLPSCIPVCFPKCLNGGYCIDPGTCKCPEGFHGERCDEVTPMLCLKPPRAVSFSTIRFDITTGQLVCDSGYRLSSGYTEVDIKCYNGKWVSNTDVSLEVSSFKCSPVCQKPCKNNGLCVGPDTCRCPPKYTGKWCQYLKCAEELNIIKNSIVEYSEDKMFGVARCKSGYRLRWGALGVKFECKEGIWEYQASKSKWLDLECHPVCHKPCVNGGICVAPGICKCPEGFFGSQCQKRYSKTITGKNCQLPFRYRDEWYYGCTGVGYHRPWCATSINAQNLITSWSVCVADLGMKKVVVTYTGDACVFPFSYRGREYTGCTAKDRGRPWCATEVNSYNQIMKWSFCNPDWGSKVVILTVRGEICDLPFEWQGRRYVGCVEDILRPWCVTATSNGVATKHGYCMTDWGYHRVTMTTGGNLCIFPFVHNSQTFDSCLMESNISRPKCAVRVDAARNALSLEECIQYQEDFTSASPFRLAKLFPRLGRHITEITTLRNLRCVLPFWYNSEQYTECTFKDSDKPWCATHIDESGIMVERDFCPPNWDIPEVHLYDYSREKTLDHLLKAGKMELHVSTVRGINCSFPFIYNGVKSYRCIEDGFQRPWCGTKVDAYLNVIESDHCPDNWDSTVCPERETAFEASSYILSDYLKTENGNPCAIPFVYLGKTRLTCTDEDAVMAWCPTQLDAQGTPVTWEYCAPEWKHYRVDEANGTVPFGRNETFAYTVCEYRRISRRVASPTAAISFKGLLQGDPSVAERSDSRSHLSSP